MRTVSTTAFTKDPQDVLDYVLDLSRWLADDTVSTVTATLASGDVVIDSAATNPTTFDVIEPYGTRTLAARKAVIVWLSAGTLNTNAEITVHIVTAEGRELDKSFLVRIRAR